MSVPLVVPHHIAIVMDGNGRWATRRFLPRLAGHKQGVDSLRRCARACVQRGVAVLTVFAFSSENWNRPVDEVSGLMELLAMALAREVPQLKKDGVRVCFVGERAGLSPKVRDGLAQAEAATAENTRLVLNVCFNYGGRWDIAQAAASLAARGERLDRCRATGGGHQDQQVQFFTVARVTRTALAEVGVGEGDAGQGGDEDQRDAPPVHGPSVPGLAERRVRTRAAGPGWGGGVAARTVE